MTDATPTENRAAMLLIHGVGQQKPYQMLDTFARGLVDHYGAGIEKIEPKLYSPTRQKQIRTRLTIHFREPIGRQKITHLDLSEFYWAGMVQGRVSLNQMLRWCLTTSVPPLKLWSQQATLPSEANKTFLQLMPTLIREFGTAFLLLLAIVLIIFPFLYVAINLNDFYQAGINIRADLIQLSQKSPGLFGATIVFILTFLEIFIFLNILQIIARLFSGKTMEKRMLRSWALASFILFLLLLPGTLILIYQYWEWEMKMFETMLDIVFSPVIVWGLVFIILAFIATRFLIDFVGDLPLYIDADEKSEFYQTRDEIKRTGVTFINKLLDDDDYSAVYVAGHSLGSVIAYDCINQIIREYRAGLRGDLDKLRGLLTFGSPLDKTYYFFRDKVGQKQAVRAQIQSYLHGFRKKSSGREYAPTNFPAIACPHSRSYSGLMFTASWILSAIILTFITSMRRCN